MTVASTLARKCVLTCICLRLLSACSPELNWRDVRPMGAAVQLLFPCKPAVESRQVSLSAGWVPMTLYVCTAAGATYALTLIDMGSADQTESAWRALSEGQISALAEVTQNLAPRLRTWVAAGAHPWRQQLKGKLPNGSWTHQEALYFTRGSWVLRATVMAERLDPDAVEVFFQGIERTD